MVSRINLEDESLETGHPVEAVWLQVEPTQAGDQVQVQALTGHVQHLRRRTVKF